MTKPNFNLTIRVNQIADAVINSFHAGVTLCLRGAPGIGKTECVRFAARQLSRDLNTTVGVVVCELASMSEVDLRGFLIPDGEHSKFTKPPFMLELEQYEYSILFLDEYLQCDSAMQKGSSSLILERRIGDHVLPPGCRVICAGNAPKHRAGAGNLLSHINNRMTVVDVVPGDSDVESWVAWAAQTGLEPEIIAFAKLRPEQVFSGEVPSDPDKAFCTPRSLALADRTAKAFPGGLRAMVEDQLGVALLSGTIGHGAAVELASMVRTALSLPSYEDVVANPSGVRLPTKLDEQYAMTMMLAMRARAEHMEQVVDYIERLGTNFQITWVVSIACRDSKLVATQRMGKFVTKHSAAIAPFQRYINNTLSAARKAA